jgi:amino acid transporter
MTSSDNSLITTPVEKGDMNDKMKEPDMSKVESTRLGQQFDIAQQPGTKRNIKSRHAQMIAIGGSIGTSLFVGTGQALAIGGPGFLFLAYILMSILVYGMVTAVVEVGTYTPVAGSSMASFASRYASSSLGFALGWLYVYSFGVILAYEITASTIIIDYWPQNVHVAVWITIMLVAIIGLNLCPVGVYAETEFWFASVKIVMILGLLLLSLILMLGGGPNHERLGFYYWVDPGATKTYVVDGAGGRFTAFLYVWIFSGFSFYFSPELIVFTSGEMQNPRKNMPMASRRFFWRLIVFYILSTIAIGAICSSTADGLTTSAGNANGSPFVIAIRAAGIRILDSIINAGILSSALSSGNSYLFMSSRSLYSLTLAGHAPAIFGRCNRFGVPYYCVLLSSMFGLLAYLNCSSQAGVVFNWFVSLTNTAGYTSWIVCCIIFLRFRKACVVQDVKVPYRSSIQPYAAWGCLLFFTVILLLNGFTLFYPGQFTASGFLTTYIGIPLFLALWLGHKLTAGKNEPWLYQPEDVDLITDVREVEADAERWARLEDEAKEGRSGPGHKYWNVIRLIWE